jgi:hypothetical protein
VEEFPKFVAENTELFRVMLDRFLIIPVYLPKLDDLGGQSTFVLRWAVRLRSL